jgi:hypothetical protein
MRTVLLTAIATVLCSCQSPEPPKSRGPSSEAVEREANDATERSGYARQMAEQLARELQPERSPTWMMRGAQDDSGKTDVANLWKQRSSHGNFGHAALGFRLRDRRPAAGWTFRDSSR